MTNLAGKLHKPKTELTKIAGISFTTEMYKILTDAEIPNFAIATNIGIS